MPKKFYIKLSLFVIFGFLILAVTNILNKNLITDKLYANNLFNFPGKMVFIIGDSHTLCAFNDSIISNSINLSKNSENYFQSYYKIKKIAENNPQIERIILNYSYCNISKTNEKTICYSEIYMRLLDNDGLNLIKNGTNYRYNLNSVSDNNVSTLINPIKNEAIGGFHKLIFAYFYSKQFLGLPINIGSELEILYNEQKSKYKIYSYEFVDPPHLSNNTVLSDESVKKAINRHFYVNNIEMDSSGIMISYLEKIALLTNERNIKLLLCNTPLNNSYKTRVPVPMVKYHSSVLEEFKRKYENVEYYDFSDMKFEDNMWGDGDHLNVLGMNKLSNEINNIIK